MNKFGKTIIITGSILCSVVLSEAVSGLDFTSGQVNTSTHKVTLALRGNPNRSITIQRFAASYTWTSIATLLLNGAGTATWVGDIELLLSSGYVFEDTHYGVYRAYETQNPTIRSSNAYAAFYGTLQQDTQNLLGNFTSEKSLSEIFPNAEDGVQISTQFGGVSIVSTFDTLETPKWNPEQTIKPGQGFWILANGHNLIGKIINLSGLYDSNPVSVLLKKNYSTILGPGNAVALPQSYDAATWLDLFNSNGYTSSTAPQVPGNQIVTYFQPRGYRVSTFDDIDNLWLPGDEIRIGFGYFYSNNKQTDYTWVFTRTIW